MTSRHHRALPLRVRGDLALSLTTTVANQSVAPVLTAAQALTLDWGDGSPEETVSANTLSPIAHTYAVAGSYTLTITDGAASLTTINIQSLPFDFAISRLSGLSNLHTLAANFSNVSGQIAALGGVPQLDRLLLALTNVTGPTQAAGFPNLTELFANGTALTGAAGLGGLTQIEDLRFDNCNFTAGEVAALVGDIHANRASFTDPAPALMIAGSNDEAAPATVVQINDLVDNFGWSISYNAPTLELTLTTSSANRQITPVFNSERGLTVDWGDGSPVETVNANTSSAVNHTYATAGSYTLTLEGGWPHLRTLDLQSDPFDFDIVALMGLPLLQTLNLNFTQVTGDIALVASLPALTDILANLSNVSGALSSFATLSNVDRVRLSNTGVSAAAGLGNLPLLADVDLGNNGFSSGAVDTIIADLYANRASQTAPSKTLTIAGSNAAPGATAQAQISDLEANFNWSITTS